jgi:DNA adenine methylase
MAKRTTRTAAKTKPKSARRGAATKPAGDRPTLRLVRGSGGGVGTAIGQPGAPQPAKPFIKWVGGKTRLLEQLDQLRPSSIGRYAEPFLGGGAVFFHLRNESAFSDAVLADTNPDVHNVFSVVRDDIDALLAALRRHQALYLTRDAEGRAAYFYAVRTQHPTAKTSPVARAARMLFLNRTCYNGLWRENKSGRFNTPHGRYASPIIAPTAKLHAASAALQSATIVRGDFRAVPKLVFDRGIDFVYMDPPYHPISVTSAFNAYSQGGFSGQDQADLADVCRELDAMGTRFMLSNSDCPLIRELYDEFDLQVVLAPRAINCKGGKRGAVQEVVVRNKRRGLTW